MRTTRLHRLMHGLALVATLALVVVPPLGRVFQAYGEGHAGHAAAATHHAGAMAAMAGPHAHHPIAAAAPALPDPAPVQHQHPRDGECDYCPLLQSMLGSAALALLPRPHLAPLAPQATFASAVPDFRHPNGLGSRGPPHLS